MSRPTPYLFCRYEITDDGDPITPDEEFEILKAVKNQPIPYFKRDPEPNDADTYLIKPRKKEILSQRIHTWEIAKDIKHRTRTVYDRATDETKEEFVDANEIQHTKFIGIPKIKVFAVDDRSIDTSLGAHTAVSRFEAIISKLVDDHEARVFFTGMQGDAQRALSKWRLDKFSFTIRPFNPTPKKLGQKMHEIMIADHIGKLTAHATPAPGQEMRSRKNGLLAEVKGLADEGYGQYGATGTTEDGLKAEITKPPFDLNKKKNLENQHKNRTIKVFVEKLATALEEEQAIVRALLDLYG